MVSTNTLAEIGLLVGEPARAAMLEALMDGRALTARELADAAGVTPQTASGHLARLSEAGLLSVARQGRHRYHRLAGPEVARLLEGMMRLASGLRPRPVRTGPRDARMRLARTCYDHLAGRLGVAIADALQSEGIVEIAADGAVLAPDGLERLRARGIVVDLDPERLGRGRRPICRPCLDWSERRPHLAGHLGVAICGHFFDRGLVHRMAGGRTLRITPAGHAALRDVFGIRERLTAE